MGQLIHTFTVESTDEIIPKVKQDYGDKALIVTNKQIRPKTINQKPLYEVIVAIEEADYEEHLKQNNLPMPPKKKTNTASFPEAKIQAPKLEDEKKEEDVVLDFSLKAKQKPINPYLNTSKKDDNFLNLKINFLRLVQKLARFQTIKIFLCQIQIMIKKLKPLKNK